MRSAWSAAVLLAALSVPGCGSDSKEMEPGLRVMFRDFAQAVVKKEDEKINSFVLPRAGQRDNPVGAKEIDNPEGRKLIVEGNRRWVRKAFKDAGILEEKDVESLMSALIIRISGNNARVSFEIAAEQRRAPEVVAFLLQKTPDKGWLIYDYEREMKTR
jgi:hypothetical protein